MADFTKTITNSLNLFGGEPATKWGDSFGTPYTMVWGTTLWGEGSYTVIIDLAKVINDSITCSDAFAKSVGYMRTISETITPVGTITVENLSDGSIWKYVYTSDTTNIMERDSASYSSGSAGSTSFTSQGGATTTWTEV